MPGAAPIPPKQRWLDRVRLNYLQGIARIYTACVPIVAIFAASTWLVAMALEVARLRLTFLALLNLGLVASVLAMTAINGIIDAFSFPSIATGAFTACYPFYFLFLFTAPIHCLHAWRFRRDPPPRSAF